MASTGWISIHRKIQEHAIWDSSEPFDKRSAWIDLILLANHEDRKILHGLKVEEVKRGSKITSLRKLSTRWKWSINKVKRFLELLQELDMISYKSDSKKTTYTIVKYNVYQNENISKRNTNGTPTENKRESNENQTETNNNDNNDNKDSQQNKFAENSIEIKLSKYLFTRIQINDEKAKEPNFQTWAKSIDYLIRLDKRDPKEVKQIIDYATSNNFWKANILSTYKLREKYQTLLLQTKGNNNTGYSKKKGYQEEIDDEERERRKAFIEKKQRERRKALNG